ncbi:MAG TPA: hypothetical protein VGJ66_01175, partial [Pyrinomonadaceae bacterium]
MLNRSILNRSLLNHLFSFAIFAALLVCAVASGSAQTKLLRFPDINGERVVFTYGGDLWTAPSSGGS